MIELVFAACLIAAPDKCRPVTLTFTDVPLIQCVMGVAAEAEIAKWITQHPGHYARKRKCRVAGQYAKA